MLTPGPGASQWAKPTNSSVGPKSGPRKPYKKGETRGSGKPKKPSIFKDIGAKGSEDEPKNNNLRMRKYNNEVRKWRKYDKDESVPHHIIAKKYAASDTTGTYSTLPASSSTRVAEVYARKFPTPDPKNFEIKPTIPGPSKEPNSTPVKPKIRGGLFDSEWATSEAPKNPPNKITRKRSLPVVHPKEKSGIAPTSKKPHIPTESEGTAPTTAGAPIYSDCTPSSVNPHTSERAQRLPSTTIKESPGEPVELEKPPVPEQTSSTAATNKPRKTFVGLGDSLWAHIKPPHGAVIVKPTKRPSRRQVKPVFNRVIVATTGKIEITTPAEKPHISTSVATPLETAPDRSTTSFENPAAIKFAGDHAARSAETDITPPAVVAKDQADKEVTPVPSADQDQSNKENPVETRIPESNNNATPDPQVCILVHDHCRYSPNTVMFSKSIPGKGKEPMKTVRFSGFSYSETSRQQIQLLSDEVTRAGVILGGIRDQTAVAALAPERKSLEMYLQSLPRVSEAELPPGRACRACGMYLLQEAWTIGWPGWRPVVRVACGDLHHDIHADCLQAALRETNACPWDGRALFQVSPRGCW